MDFGGEQGFLSAGAKGNVIIVVVFVNNEENESEQR
jgi:hypothetical protein